ncbi:chemotaxis protein CheW [Rheinheimera soli]|uniref:Purine-binding chemotaxis protein CheW n=1 Tax=Rheinheimera soli TaxID=443616 RepID=A0ABU1W3Z1_9GAMM|nr:chemotaxis protein CheW [Rheinheimera soli]MDR7122697.1 purine-binding chemotaxis protein CheW [Rheinheimera soli]
MPASLNPGHQFDWHQIKQQLAELELQLDNQCSAENERITQALQKRTAALAEKPAEGSLQLVEVLRFDIGTERYAIHSTYVSEVLPIYQITALFDLPAYMAGICYVRGRVVSVLDLRILFQLPGVGLTDRNMLVLLKNEQMEFGLLVDVIIGIQLLDLTGLNKSLPNLDPIRLRYLQGVTRDQTIFLDGHALLTDPELIISQEFK